MSGRWRRLRKALPLLVVAVLAAGCAVVTGQHDGRTLARALAGAHGFTPLRLDGGEYVLQGWLRGGPASSGGVLHVYIEGDGFAWRTRTEPSDDPTPRMPRGLALAAADPATDPVLYLGRPCQYVEGRDRRLCTPEAWTTRRYGEAVFHSLNAAVDEVKSLVGAARVAVYGYSGGGTMAALLAERRTDVLFWATVAGNLDVDAWAEFHHVSPLTGSLNPARHKAEAAAIPQVHVAGERDRVVPPLFARAWCAGEQESLCRVVEVPDMGHFSPWEGIWPEIVRRFRQLSPE